MEYTKRRNLNLGFRWHIKLLPPAVFEEFDKLHYEVENKLLALISALESKRGSHEWQATLPQSH